MEQGRHSKVSTARQRVEVKVERHQLFLLFIIGLIVLALVFSVGVMTGKRLTGLAAGGSVSKGDLKTMDKAAEAEKALKKADAAGVRNGPPQQGGASPGGILAQLAVTAKEPPLYKTEKAAKEPAPERPAAKESKAAPVKEKASESVKAASDKPSDKAAKNGKDKEMETAGSPVKEPAAPGAPGESVAVEYCLQIAALPDRNQAVALAAQMEKKGFQTHISTAQVAGKGTMYRVRLGHFKSRDEANAFHDEFQRKENRSGFVTPTK